MPDQQPVWLLDKNTVRRAIEGITFTLAQQIVGEEQSQAVNVIFLASKTEVRLAIAPETANILTRYSGNVAVQFFLRQVVVMAKGRYFIRWARRLRYVGFTREDAKMISYATFGLDSDATTLGASLLITFDKAMVHNYQTQYVVLKQKLTAMQSDLPNFIAR